MRSFKIGTLVVVLAAFAAPALSACGSNDHGKQQEAAGTLSLNLSGTGTSGATYRLRNATFDVNGPRNVTLSSETDVNASSIRQELPAGNFIITLEGGWTLEKGSGGTFTPVQAVLTSTNPEGFTITDQGTTAVVFQFNAGDDVVQLGDGTLLVQIGVNDSCAAGQASCGGTCRDLSSDPQNCGACGSVCMGSQCVNGQCVQACAAGQLPCNGGCVDPNSDPQNCGGCGIVCATGFSCSNGMCTSSAPPANFIDFFDSIAGNPNACNDWNNFLASIGPGPYSTVTLKSEFGTQSCAGPEADQICQALHQGQPISVVCNNGTTWTTDGCGGGELTADGSNCACTTPGAAIRPCIGSGTVTGGVGTSTCNAPSQTISVTCQ